jgi:hypothetical protein
MNPSGFPIMIDLPDATIGTRNVQAVDISRLLLVYPPSLPNPLMIEIA